MSAFVRCDRCGAAADAYVEVTTLGDIEPRYLVTRCSQSGCGTTCPICRRAVGDIHSGACMPLVEAKLTDKVYVTRQDCLVVTGAR